MRLRFVALLLLAIIPAFAPAESSVKPMPCLLSLELRNSWTAIPLPDGAKQPVVIAESNNHPCSVYALSNHRDVFRSDDGGRAWTKTFSSSVDEDHIVAAALADNTVALYGASGLLISRDAASSFQASTGLSGVTVLSVSADPSHLSVLYAAVASSGTGAAGTGKTLPSPAPALPGKPGPSVFVSLDNGVSFSSLPGSSAFTASVVGVDPSDSSVVWANDTTAGGLWRSSNSGQFFTQETAASAVDGSAILTARQLVFSLMDGGGSVLFGPTQSGILRTADSGSTFTRMVPGTNVQAMAAEHKHPTVLMAIIDGHMQRTTTGDLFHQANSGLPDSCAPGTLDADSSVPSVFLTSCDGRTYRYQSDGSDLSGIDAAGSTPNGLGNSRLQTTHMTVLGHLTLPNDADGQSGSIAFDGHIIYYTDHSAGHIRRADTITKQQLPDLKLSNNHVYYDLAYDSLRHLLYALDDAHDLNSIDLKTLKVTKMFTDQIGAGGWASYSYDPSIDRFRVTANASDSVSEVDRQGQTTNTCSPSRSILIVNPNGPAGSNGIAAIVASGDGGMYAELEDDATVIRMDRNCEVVALFSHDSFSEARDENDQMACDTVTFGKPAVWIRDADAKVATAFGVPGGYCALATTLTVTTSPTLDLIGAAPLCAKLRLSGEGSPLEKQSIQFFVADHAVGSGVTDPSGVACTTYQPSLFSSPGTTTPNTSGKILATREVVLANFLGTSAYRPASATGLVTVLNHFPPVVRPPQQIPPLPLAVQPPVVAIAPANPPPPGSQPNPIPQSHPGAQPGALGQPGAAAHQEEEVDAADQSADVHKFVAYNDHSSSPAPMIAIIGFAFAVTELQRRRGRSRVRANRG